MDMHIFGCIAGIDDESDIDDSLLGGFEYFARGGQFVDMLAECFNKCYFECLGSCLVFGQLVTGRGTSVNDAIHA